MDLIDKIKEIANRYDKQAANIQTEEATKNALIMPFIAALGYDIFNPSEVIPEFTADVGIKKGEKVDYAIKKDDQIIMLFECKHCGANLQNEHASQLYRYFHTSAARFGVLTNGLIYQFYSDIEEPNKMDEKPFFEIDIRDIGDNHIEELKKFAKSNFSLTDILTTASSLKYKGELIKCLEREAEAPSDALVKFFVSQIYTGRATQPIIELFSKLVKEGLNEFINNRINLRLKSALSQPQIKAPQPDPEPANAPIDEKQDVITTQEETDGFLIVKAIARQAIKLDRIVMRDTKSYCGILLDDNNRKPICRLHFNASKKYIELGRSGERIPIIEVDDIYQYTDQILKVIDDYEKVGES
ncbi:type I restriction endonuclease [Methylomonas fluvii]|uniref:Type I restriction enzyme HsdR N-terminal domain-containing protein n=1 Tax=Methylomonas fluvii TaxID=1854564 RepID=A0ABR9DCM0_9GAMM|nr:type I restriction endonuclease [Methylomonas fluvii]MBD9359647.1 type I restriction enzyme HsdR N-terminal domain-containing protein [Methylomonas fluvii]CAD6872389.1 Prophage Lp2 protein 6 [Methylomonas fluvii]